MLRLDKTIFSKGTHAAINKESVSCLQDKSLAEKWEIGTYLTSVAYGFNGASLPKMQKVFVRKGKHLL